MNTCANKFDINKSQPLQSWSVIPTVKSCRTGCNAHSLSKSRGCSQAAPHPQWVLMHQDDFAQGFLKLGLSSPKMRDLSNSGFTAMEKLPGRKYMAQRGPSITPSSTGNTLSPLCHNLQQSREICHPTRALLTGIQQSPLLFDNVTGKLGECWT